MVSTCCRPFHPHLSHDTDAADRQSRCHALHPQRSKACKTRPKPCPPRTKKMHPTGTHPRQGIRLRSRAGKYLRIVFPTHPHTCPFEEDIMFNSCVLLKHNTSSTRTPPKQGRRYFPALLGRSFPAPCRTAFFFSSHRPRFACHAPFSAHRHCPSAASVSLPRTHADSVKSYGLRTTSSLRAPIVRTPLF